MVAVVAKWEPKDPGDTLDYWVTLELPTGVTITSIIVEPPVDSGLTKVGDEDFLDLTIRVRLAGGDLGKHLIQYIVNLSTGEIVDFEVTLQVKERVKA